MAPGPTHKTVFYKTKSDKDEDKKKNGSYSMYTIDAAHAVANFPDEWSYEPWDDSEGPNLPNGEPRAVIPNDWIDMKPSEKLHLARQLGAKDVRSGADADKFINDYLVKRANAAPIDPKTPIERPQGERQEMARTEAVEDAQPKNVSIKGPVEVVDKTK